MLVDSSCRWFHVKDTSVQQLSLKEMSKLGELITVTISSVTGICHEPEYIQLVLDSYLEYSLKEGE